jgi:undecaprenyl pyrophosphate phosphatase UppP
MGFDSRKSFELSWLIATPLFLAASAYAVWQIWRHEQMHYLVYGAIPYLAVAALVAYAALCITARLLHADRGWLFGVYMAIPLLLCLVCL